jgi:hypothetical protein
MDEKIVRPAEKPFDKLVVHRAGEMKVRRARDS